MVCVNEYDEEHIYEAPNEVEAYEVPKVEAVPKQPSDNYQAAAATDWLCFVDSSLLITDSMVFNCIY